MQYQQPLHFDLQTFQQKFIINQKEVLGKGFDSVVYKVMQKDDNKFYALKLTNFKDLQHKYNFQIEIQLLHHIRHENIVQFYGNSIDGSCILIEYMPYGNLGKLVNQKLDIKLINCIINEIIQAVSYLHQNGVVHGDLKPENALISEDFRIKICDFGFAKVLNQPNVRLLGGSEGYTAPEVLNPQEYDCKKVDIFALGVFHFVMYLGYRPFLSTNPQKQDKFWNLIKSNQWDQFWKLFQGKQLDEGFKKYFQKMIAVEQKDRYTIDEMKKDEWFCKNQCSREEMMYRLKEIFKQK